MPSSRRPLKYTARINYSSQAVLELPPGPIVLARFHAGDGEAVLTIWVEALWPADDDIQLTARTFDVVGTGGFIHDGAQHIESHQDDAYIWHIYELPTAPSTEE